MWVMSIKLRAPIIRHSCPDLRRNRGLQVSDKLFCTLALQCTLRVDHYSSFLSTCLLSQSCMNHSVSGTKEDGWEVNEQTLQAFPKQENYIFQVLTLLLFFFKMPSYAVWLSEQWNENKIKGQMPTPSRNVMEKKQIQVKGFPC